VRIVRSPIAPGWVIGLGFAAIRTGHRVAGVGPSGWHVHTDHDEVRARALYQSRAQLRDLRRDVRRGMTTETVTPKNPGDPKRLSVLINAETQEFLRDVTASDGIFYTEAVRRAVSYYKLHVDARRRLAQVHIIEPNGDVTEVVGL